MPVLSKSKLLAFRQCPKRLWLEIHRPETRGDSGGADERLEVGREVGQLAIRLYDPAQLGTVINADPENIGVALMRSSEMLATSRHPVFEAGMEGAGALIFADVMLPVLEGVQMAWRMIEVKSSASVKEYHSDELAVQAYVAHAARVNLKSVALAHIDSSWVYPGENDYRGLLKEVDLTEDAVARRDEVKAWIADAHQVAVSPEEPKKEMGSYCYDPFPCGFCGYCNQGTVPPDHPLDWLPRLSTTKREGLEQQGINDLCDVPDELLNATQSLVKQHTLAKTVFFDATGAAADLAPHGLPAYFLDFETTSFAIPIWKGTRPFQQIPFQLSVHVLEASGAIQHRQFLDLSGNDPSEPFAKTLLEACGATGPVYVYNAGFETARIKELAQRFPKLAGPLLAINERIVDLLPVARTRYYHHQQQGSWSIKAVLPAAIPELSYENLEGVKDGGSAMAAFLEAISPSTTDERKREIEAQLLAYCHLDTFAMVRLWQFFSGSKVALRAG